MLRIFCQYTQLLLIKLIIAFIYIHTMTETPIWLQTSFTRQFRVTVCVLLCRLILRRGWPELLDRVGPKRLYDGPLLLYIREMNTAQETLMLAKSMQGKWL